MFRESASVHVRSPRSAAWVTGGAAAPLDAATGSCPGRELHLLFRRALPARTA